MADLLILPDLSEFQANANMAAIKERNGGAAIIRAAYGSREDTAFEHLRAAASGFAFLGIYQYLRANQNPSVQAESLRGITGKLAAHEIPVCDLEEGDGNQAGRAQAWLSEVDSAYGLDDRPLPERSWLYSYQAFVTGHGLAGLFASARRTWIAAYSGTEPDIGHTLWQSTDGVIGSHITNWPGAGDCDTNVYHGTITQLAAVIAKNRTDPPHLGPVRHVADGTKSLNEIAAERHTTAAHLEAVSRAHLTPVHLHTFNSYVRGGTGRKMTAGQPWWSSQ